MSKQVVVADILNEAQCTLAKTLYWQWLRAAFAVASEAGVKPVVVTPNHVSKKLKGGKGFRMAAAVPVEDGGQSGSDAVAMEVERWRVLSPDITNSFIDEETGMMNEFALLWYLRRDFPIHFVVFCQTAAHLPHEAKSEQTFSRAGNISDPNMNPAYLAQLTAISINKRVFQPNVKSILGRYLNLYSKGGQDCGMEDSDMGIMDEELICE